MTCGKGNSFNLPFANSEDLKGPQTKSCFQVNATQKLVWSVTAPLGDICLVFFLALHLALVQDSAPNAPYLLFVHRFSPEPY